MKKALVLGATGSMGIHLTTELAKRGIEVVAFARNPKKLHRYFGAVQGISIRSGDAFNPDDVTQASEGVDIIYHTANIPYNEWFEKLQNLMDNVLNAAKKNNCKIAYVDNIYAYGESPGHPVSETQPKTPHTRKGKLRLQLEKKLLESHTKETPTLIAHFPDFYGPHAGNTLLNTTLQPLAAGRRAIFVGQPTIKREYIFLPDAATALVNLSLQEKHYGQNWNIPGAGTISGHEILQIAENVLKRQCRCNHVGRISFFLAGLFNPFMNEVREMLYLTENPVILDGSKYSREMGPVPNTSYEKGLQFTLESYLNSNSNE